MLILIAMISWKMLIRSNGTNLSAFDASNTIIISYCWRPPVSWGGFKFIGDPITAARVEVEIQKFYYSLCSLQSRLLFIFRPRSPVTIRGVQAISGNPEPAAIEATTSSPRQQQGVPELYPSRAQAAATPTPPSPSRSTTAAATTADTSWQLGSEPTQATHTPSTAISSGGWWATSERGFRVCAGFAGSPRLLHPPAWQATKSCPICRSAYGETGIRGKMLTLQPGNLSSNIF